MGAFTVFGFTGEGLVLRSKTKFSVSFSFFFTPKWRVSFHAVLFEVQGGVTQVM